MQLLLLAAVTAAGLHGCFLPLRFDVDATITRTGYFDLKFDGDLAWLPLVREIAEGSLDADERRAKIARIETDLERDPATRTLRHVGDGVFRLQWRRSGDLLQARSVNFVRRSDRIFGIKYVESTGQVTLEGRAISANDARRLRERGITSTGSLKLRTDARVVDHNAARVVPIGPRERIYVWTIASLFDPAAKLVIALH
ncbi:MAG: hypothetical protein IPM60_07110 [Rhodospirillales bacterium]|nr:hypothetical protein [Rhodospirillales bacterium]